jgi:phospholipase/carboxylesterase
MSGADLAVQVPQAPAQQLMLLAHGYGADAQDLVPLGQQLAQRFPRAWIVSLDGGAPAGRGAGRQWFGLEGIDEEARVQRVDAALPGLLARVAALQASSGVGIEGTALIGFSQGAIMALAASLRRPACAGRVVAICGRYAAVPGRSDGAVTVHLFSGEHDPLFPPALAQAAHAHLQRMGGDTTHDCMAGVAHALPADMAGRIAARLTGTLPRRRWEEAMGAVAGPGGPGVEGGPDAPDPSGTTGA